MRSAGRLALVGAAWQAIGGDVGRQPRQYDDLLDLVDRGQGRQEISIVTRDATKASERVCYQSKNAQCGSPLIRVNRSVRSLTRRSMPNIILGG